MYYVYYKSVSSGREDFVAIFDTAEEAVRKIASCYEIDRGTHALGHYYYFMKVH